MEEPEASDQIARFNIDCVRQTNADRKLANDVKILETSRETLVFGQVRNKSRAVIDSEVVDVATAKFFAKKRGERILPHATSSTRTEAPFRIAPSCAVARSYKCTSGPSHKRTTPQSCTASKHERQPTHGALRDAENEGAQRA